MHAFHFRVERLFNNPQLWNSNFFMSKETMRVLSSLIDVWLPDFKFGPGKCALDLSRTPWYWDTVTNNLRLIYGWDDDDNIIPNMLNVVPNQFLIGSPEICRKFQ